MQINVNYILKKIAKVRDKENLVFFDLDSTIYDLTPRQSKILYEFANTYKNEGSFLPVAESILQAKFTRFPFFAENALKQKNIPIHPVFKKYFYPFWYERFFSNEYVLLDDLELGVKEFINELSTLGCRIFYLTGRDEPRMGKGTIKKLLGSGLMQHGEKLILKPQKELIDREFKLNTVRSFNKENSLIFFIDNEASNSNYVLQHMPEVVNIFYDSVHSESEQPSSKLFVLSAFC